MRTHGDETARVLQDLRGNRVRELRPGTVLEILQALPEWQPGGWPAAIVLDSRDVPEIAEACRGLRSQGAMEATFAALEGQLETRWS